MLKILAAVSLSLVLATPAAAYSGGCRTAGKTIGNGSPALKTLPDVTVTLADPAALPATRAIAVADVTSTTVSPPEPQGHCGETPRLAE